MDGFGNESGASFIACSDLDEGLVEDDVPGPSGKSRLVAFNCGTCGKTFKSVERYKGHLKVHIVEDLYRTGPGQEAVIEESRRTAKVDLADFSSLQPECGITPLVKSLSSELLSSFEDNGFGFVDPLASRLWKCIRAPSAIDLRSFHSAYLQETRKVFYDSEVENAFEAEVLKMVKENYPKNVLHWVFVEFATKLSSKLVAFYLKCIREPHASLVYKSSTTYSSDSDDLEFQQTIHYIGGSVVKSVMRQGRSSDSVQWKNVLLCLHQKFSCGTLSSAPDSEVALWTESRSRGGLQFISASVWNFLMALSGLLPTMEEDDGSLKHSAVLQKLKSDDVLVFLWDEIHQGTLSLEDSFFLQERLCTLFVNTWGRGISLRRKNAIKNLNCDKAPLRASLVTRK